MHADRTNRVVLTVVGSIATLAGAGGLLAAYGVLGDRFRHRRLFDNQFADYFRAHSDWLWWAIAGVALVVVLLALLWLLRLLFATDRIGRVTVDPGSVRAVDVEPVASGMADASQHPRPRHGTGRTTLAAGALAEAVAGEIEAYHGVSSAKARVLGSPQRPVLVIDVTVSRRADVATLVSRVQDEVVTHAQEAVAPADLQITLDIAVNDKGAPRAL